jgi:hypothetical protein
VLFDVNMQSCGMWCLVQDCYLRTCWSPVAGGELPSAPRGVRATQLLLLMDTDCCMLPQELHLRINIAREDAYPADLSNCKLGSVTLVSDAVGWQVVLPNATCNYRTVTGAVTIDVLDIHVLLLLRE